MFQGLGDNFLSTIFSVDMQVRMCDFGGLKEMDAMDCLTKHK